MTVQRRRSRAVILLVLLGSQLAVASCGNHAPVSVRPQTILLVVLDTTRVDHLGSYGYPRATTPNIDRFFQADSVIFDKAVAASNNTLLSHASMFTGLYVNNHGVKREGSGVTQLSDAHETLAELLSEKLGYYTIGAVSAEHLNHEHSGFGQGYDSWFGCAPNEIQRPATETNREFVGNLDALLRKRAGEPVFLWVHYFDPHHPYIPGPPFDDTSPDPPPIAPAPPLGMLSPRLNALRSVRVDRKIDAYDSEIRVADKALATVFETLEKHGRLSDAVVLLVADHGENLGEHDMFFTHAGLYSQVTHVPLFIRIPGITDGPSRRLSSLVHHIDLLPTILDVAGLPEVHWPPVDGQSLLPLIRGDRHDFEGRTVFGQSIQAGERMAVTERYKLIIDDVHQRMEFFDIAADPDEKKDIGAQLPDVRDKLLHCLMGHLGSSKFIIFTGNGSGTSLVDGWLRPFATESIVEAVGFERGDFLQTPSEGDSYCFRFSGDGDKMKGLVVDMPHSSCLVDLCSNEDLAINPSEMRRSQGHGLPIVFLSESRSSPPWKAATNKRPLVVVTQKNRQGVDHTTFLVEVLETERKIAINLRFGTNGSIEQVRGVRGELEYRLIASGGPRFRIDIRDSTAGGALTVTTKPADSFLVVDGRADGVPISHRSFRTGDRNDPRGYPTTFLISTSSGLLPIAPSSVRSTAAERGIHIGLIEESKRSIQGGARTEALLRALGYLED